MWNGWMRWMLLVAGVALVALAYEQWSWPGVALVAGGLVMWLLLHFTRLMTVLRRAAGQPIGHVGSAVMLNAKLRAGMTLMHVIAMTRSLGQQESPQGEQPEVFVWRDAGDSLVRCEFRQGRLQAWHLTRPAQPAQDTAEAPSALAQDATH
jgi:hypothetical protein